MIVRNFDQNINTSEYAKRFITDVGDSQSEKYGDRSGIRMWGYDKSRKLWIVKRNSGKIEYYDKKVAFTSWTKVDLSELSNAPFYNPTKDNAAWNFKRFLENQVKQGFPNMSTAESVLKKDRGRRDPQTGKRLKKVVWPATAKVKLIPMPAPIADGALSEFEFWYFDGVTAVAVVRTRTHQYKLIEPRDLLKFGENDIKLLARTQIKVPEPIFEEAAKEFTKYAALIANRRIWHGAIEDDDAVLIPES